MSYKEDVNGTRHILAEVGPGDGGYGNKKAKIILYKSIA